MSAELNRLVAAVRQAGKDLDDYLRATYPVGMGIGVSLKHSQINPTWGIVYSHWSGNIQVHFPNARKPYRHIIPSNVMATGEPA